MSHVTGLYPAFNRRSKEGEILVRGGSDSPSTFLLKQRVESYDWIKEVVQGEL
jgi:hypothetical protein